tara:strand:+ start:3253 stop:3537 length:285 start_codon:yes stop_codon:yes gene_type:complete
MVVNEEHFQLSIIELAKLRGYEHIYHTHDSRHSPAGFPDLIMLKGGRMIVAELKMPGKQPTEEQYFWLCAFSRLTDDVYLWYPEDRNEIERVVT